MEKRGREAKGEQGGVIVDLRLRENIVAGGALAANRFRPVRQPMRANHATCQAIRRGPQAAPWKNMEVPRPSSK